MMKTSPGEHIEMTKDPQAFVVLALDTCDKQNFKVLKTQGAKLLEAICDNIDGSVSFITYFCCQSINYALGQAIPADQQPNFNQFKLFQQPTEIIAETCIVALTSLSYILPRRNDLIPDFERTLENNMEAILS